MKKLLCTLLILGSLSGMAQAKPGGWIKDFFQNNSVSVSSTSYYGPSPAYYVETPRYYSAPPPLIYERPTYYYCPPPRPLMVPMQPYQNHYRYYR